MASRGRLSSSVSLRSGRCNPIVSRKAKKDHPWRQGYQGIRPNHSHPVISPLVGMRTPTIQQQQKGTFLISLSPDEQDEQLNLAQAIRDMLGWANKRRTRLESPGCPLWERRVHAKSVSLQTEAQRIPTRDFAIERIPAKFAGK